MKNKGWVLVALQLFLVPLLALGNGNKDELAQTDGKGLKDAFENRFGIGVALSDSQIMGRDAEAMEVVKEHFNAIVAENCMKSGRMQPTQGEFLFELADSFVEFGEANNMAIHGHTLIWHSQAPRWFFRDDAGNDVSREVLIQRMKDHIYTVVKRYKGRIQSWDVVNEAILDDGSFRKSKFYEIIGEDFIKLAFQFAHEADPDAKLFYNDYSMAIPKKREGVVAMVKKLQEQGVRIDGIGMQGHVGLRSPTIQEFEKSILAFSSLGVKVMITELDLTVLPSPWEDAGAELTNMFEYRPEMDPYTSGMTAEAEKEFSDRYLSFFKLFMKHQDKIERVTLWGVNDGHSWKNNWPIRGRTDYPLLFDRENNPKPVIYEIIKAAK